MTLRGTRWRVDFHEAPLVVFTAAAVAGGGLAAAGPLLFALGLRADLPGRSTAVAALVLLGGGLLVSIGHLGRPSRMALAFRHAGTNALGTEVMFAALTAAVLTFLSFQENAAAASKLWMCGAVCSMGLLASLAWVYWLSGQIAWRGVPALSAVPLGLLFGTTTQIATAVPLSDLAILIASALAVDDAAAWIVRCVQVERMRRAGETVHPGVMQQRWWLFVSRFLLISVPSGAVLMLGTGNSALVLLALGILTDRFAFYGLAIRKTTEHEVAHIESLLRSLDERPRSA